MTATLHVFRAPAARPASCLPATNWRGPAMPVFCAVLLWALPGTARADQVRWRTDYAQALREAAQRGAPLVVNVGTVDCFWCKQLDARTFIDEEIIRLLNDRCVPIKLDANHPGNNYLVQALRVQSYPTLIYASHDGNILGFREGFIEAGPFKEQLAKVLAAVGTPDWMQRDFDAAGKAVAAADYARALTLLKTVVEDGKNRPVQVRARLVIAELEKQVAEQAQKAQELADQGKSTEAIAALEALSKSYAGTHAARKGAQLRLELMNRTGKSGDERRQQAEALLRQAREDYKNRHFLCALDRCEDLAARFSDLPEAAAADRLAAEIKENPEWTKKACDQLADRMSVLYLALADSWLKKGQPQQAIYYLERVCKMFPGTRHAELAQTRLTRLRGVPGGPDRK